MSAAVSASALPYPTRYYYVFKSSTGLVVTVMRGQAPPKIVGGVGGWEIIPRRRRKGLTSWQGRDPIQMDVPIQFDGGMHTPLDMGPDISTLRQMAIGDNFITPPRVTIEGILPANGVTWVINDIDWGDDVKWVQDDTGVDIRIRQDAVVHLIQFVQEDVVNILNASGQPGIYTTHAGDTLRSIAKAVYGDAALWTYIRDANPNLPTQDPNRPLPAGLVLRYPLSPKGTG